MRYASVVMCLALSILETQVKAENTFSTISRTFDVAAIYFPSWHQDDHYSSWFGEKWNEWNLVMNSSPRYPGHKFLRPQIGPFDEANPQQMSRQIDLAADHGIDVFIFDWYWYSGVRFIERALTDGFLKAPNRSRMKYALMWANHDWRNYFPAPLKGESPMLLPIRHSVDDWMRVVRYCAEYHFNRQNYWRVNGAVYFSFFQPDLFVERLGGTTSTREAIETARKYLRDKGIGELHLAAFVWQPHQILPLKAAGFDSFTSYNATSSGKTHLPEQPLDDYDDLVAAHPRFWEALTTSDTIYCPVVTIGWDPSPRWDKDTPWPPTRQDYPYSALVSGTNPKSFGKLCELAHSHVERDPARPPMVLINAWNEWTEGSALLPTTEFGSGYLTEVRRVFGERH